MLTELLGKGGRICRAALDQKQRCPLIVRPTSEDVITGHLCQVLRILNARWWLPDLLNLALGAQRFRRQVHRRLRISPWENRPRYPKELLPWREGSTQVDMTVRWENLQTTVYVEAKYGSDLSATTAGNNGHHGYPADQLIRNIRVGLADRDLRDVVGCLDQPFREQEPRRQRFDLRRRAHHREAADLINHQRDRSFDGHGVRLSPSRRQTMNRHTTDSVAGIVDRFAHVI